MSSQGLHQTRKVGMLKTLKISLLGSQDLNKNHLKPFFYTPKAVPRPYKVSTYIWLVVSRRPKRSQDAPRVLPGTTKDLPEPPDDPRGPPWNVKSLPRTYQVPSRALLTSPKGTPDAKKRPEEHQVCVCPTPGTTTTTQYKHQVRKVCGCVAPSLINEQPMISHQMVAVPACSFRFLPVPCFPPTRVIHRFPWIRRSCAAS
jgi:hypothetical protein